MDQKSSLLEKLKTKWGVKSLGQVILILIVFSLTGMTVVLVKPLVFALFDFDDSTPFWLKTVTYLSLIFPMYQVLILIYGFIFGQFNFFWEKEKKLFSFILKPFRNKD